MGHGLYHWHWGIESWTIGNQHGSEWWVVGGWHLIALFVFHLNIKNILVEKKLIDFGVSVNIMIVTALCFKN